jgi:protein ImuB
LLLVPRAPSSALRPRPGLPLAEALAIEPRLHVEPHDPAADLDALGRLAEWAGRFSPIVAIESSQTPVLNAQPSTRNSLLLDITGCAACFGGESKLLQRAVRELREQGWSARVAIADTVGGAWGLAHYGRTPSLVPPGRTVLALMPLPIAALRLPDETVAALAELGIERIGKLLALPRSSLPVRLGPDVLERLDQALGRLPELLVPHRPLPVVEDLFSFEYATDQRDVLGYAIDRLIEGVCRTLEERCAGARQIECYLYHEVARPQRLEVGLYRPSRSPRHLKMLLRTRLEQIRIDEPVSAIKLRVPLTAPLDFDQAEIFDAESAHDAGDLSRLLDELSVRLGREAVTQPRLVADPQPEHACRFEPVIEGKTRRHGDTETRRERALFSASLRLRVSASLHRETLDSRPLRLLPQPVPIRTTSVIPDGPPVHFRWAGVEHRIARAWGPERIETGWWRAQDVHRDYYRVETTHGTRFWLYRRRDDGRWFLHGCFD